MTRPVLRWIVVLVAFWVLGPLAASLTGAVRAPDGGPDTSMLVSESRLFAIGAVAASFALALLAGAVGSRGFGTRTGFFAAGLVLVWPAWKSGTVMGILRDTQSGGTLWTLAIEGFVIGTATAGIAFLIARCSPDSSPTKPSGSNPEPAALPLGPLVGLAAGAVGALACARTELPGQAIAAAFAAGLVGAMAAMLLDPRARPAPILAAVALLAFVGPASGAVLDGDLAIRHLYEGALTPLARLTPLHWAAGLLLGVPVGASWASGMIRKA